ncbi:hypothetical protein PuT2_11445 [Pusillimonas sp. T2]|nr:hypothetical protein PuT2_11445 [Pusillimonas sp. T2]
MSVVNDVFHMSEGNPNSSNVLDLGNGTYTPSLFDEIEAVARDLKPTARISRARISTIEPWIEHQLSLDFAQDALEYLLDAQASDEVDQAGLDAADSVDLGDLVIDDAFVERWVANMGPFDLARAMLLEAVRDLVIGSPENRRSAISWILNDEPDSGLSFDVSVVWLTEMCTLPGREINVVMPDDLEDRVEHMRNACLQRPFEMYHLLKNFEDFSDYTKEKLQTLREQNLPTARDLLLADEQGSNKQQRLTP